MKKIASLILALTVSSTIYAVELECQFEGQSGSYLVEVPDTQASAGGDHSSYKLSLNYIENNMYKNVELPILDVIDKRAASGDSVNLYYKGFDYVSVSLNGDGDRPWTFLSYSAGGPFTEESIDTGDCKILN